MTEFAAILFAISTFIGLPSLLLGLMFDDHGAAATGSVALGFSTAVLALPKLFKFAMWALS